MAYIPETNSVVAFQSDPTKLVGTFSVVGLPTNQNVAGSVVAFQGTDPFRVTHNNNSVIAVNQGSIGAVIIGGSIATSSPANQSVSGTVDTRVIASVATVIIGGSIAASFTPPDNQSVSGTVNIGNFPGITSLVSTVPSSVIVGSSIFGPLPAGTAMLGSVAVYQGVIPWTINSIYGNISGSVAATITNTNVNVSGSVVAFGFPTNQNVSGSVVAFQGTSPWVVNFQNSSILAVPVGSTTALLQGTSIVGTYAEDAAHTTGEKGLFALGVRNDTLASVTSADGDYSPTVQGPVGETIVANSPITKWVQGTASMLTGTPVNGGSVAIIAAQGSSIFTYITGIQIANPSANNVFIRFDGGTSSTVGYTIAPAYGGSNIILPNAWKTNANAAFTASVSAVASIYLSAQGFIAKT